MKPRIAQAVRKGIVIRTLPYSKKSGSAYHWTYVLRAKDKKKRERIAQGMERAVKCKKITYSNEASKNARLFDAVKPYGFDCMKLKKRTTTNCCNLVSVACRYAGMKTPRKSSARTMCSKWKKYGFKCMKFTGKRLQRGDILVDVTEPKVHTAVFLG